MKKRDQVLLAVLEMLNHVAQMAADDDCHDIAAILSEAQSKCLNARCGQRSPDLKQRP